MITGNWGDFVEGVSARVHEIIDETRELGPSFMDAGIFEKVQSDGLIYRTEGVTGLNYLEIFAEGDSVKEDKTYHAYKTEYVMKQSGKVVSITQMLANTRSSELEAKLSEVKQNMVAANRTLNKWAWQVFVDGFATSDSSSNFPTARLSDAVALYSTAHPSLVAGVSNRSNRLTSDPVLSETNLYTALKMVREQLNGRGLPIAYEGKFLLIVPPALEKTAVEITDSQLRSGTGNNDVNYFNGGMIDVITSVYLGSANSGSETAWYVVAKDAPNMPFKYVSLIDPKIEQEVDFDTKSIRVSVDMACAFGFSNFEYTAASDGTAD
jgi:hypothetical protein